MVSQRINGERLVLLGWSRAILMQLAHPLVAAGVADHSAFRSGPLVAARRLYSTVGAMLALTFGDASGKAAAIDRIRAIHKRVHGQLKTAVGRFPEGTPYSAEDPELVLWVHVTLLDSIPLAYETLVGPLSPADRNAYCDEAASVAIDLGAVAADVPRQWSDVTAQLDRMMGSGTLCVGPDAFALGSAVLTPPISALTGTLGWANRLLTAALLPVNIREQYGLSWDERRARHCTYIVRLCRGVRRLAPDRIARWTESRDSLQAR